MKCSASHAQPRIGDGTRSGMQTIALLSAYLALAFCVLLRPVSAQESTIEGLRPTATTINRAQALEWLDSTEFAVGRWDGSVTIFRMPKTGEYGPVILQAFALPSGRGVEMLMAIDGLSFVSSDGPDRLALWRREAATKPFRLAKPLTYESKYGAANSATLLTTKNASYMATGHENGSLLIWARDRTGAFKIHRVLDLQSDNPIPSPYPLRNIRGVAPWRAEHVITGSEDGDIVAVNVPAGREVFRIRYNATAQRGINSISVLDDWLLLANCSVGPTDMNLWLYDLATGRPVLRDSANLELDSQRTQVFNFDAILLKGKQGLSFFSSTEEGLLWQGKIADGQLVVTGVTRVAPDGGAALQWHPKTTSIATAAYQISLFAVP